MKNARWSSFGVGERDRSLVGSVGAEGGSDAEYDFHTSGKEPTGGILGNPLIGKERKEMGNVVDVDSRKQIDILVNIASNCGHPLPQYALTADGVVLDVRNNVKFFLYDIDGEFVGFASYRLDEESRVGELVHIGVSLDFHNLGIAGELYNALEQKISNKGIKKIYLWTWDGNVPAKQFWIKQGFHLIRTSNNHYPGGEVAVLLEKSVK